MSEMSKSIECFKLKRYKNAMDFRGQRVRLRFEIQNLYFFAIDARTDIHSHLLHCVILCITLLFLVK